MTIKTQNWAQIRSRYEGAEANVFSTLGIQTILAMLDWIRSQNLEPELFAATSMWSILLSDKEDFNSGENMLRIEPIGEHISFEYSRLEASTDGMEKTVMAEDAIETLRLFLAYKFGIHRESENPIESQQIA